MSCQIDSTGGMLKINACRGYQSVSWLALGVGFGRSFLDINANTELDDIRSNTFNYYWSFSLNFQLVKF